MNLSHWYYFKKLAEVQHYSKAVKRQGIHHDSSCSSF